MKNILALLLAVVMSVCLVACGDGETPSANNTTETTESPNANHSLLTHLYGEWEVYTDYSDPFRTFTIHVNGKCVVDGIDATWKIADLYTTDDNLYIEIYNDDEHLGGIMIWGNNKAVEGVGTNYGFTQGYYQKVSH